MQVMRKNCFRRCLAGYGAAQFKSAGLAMSGRGAD